jgi:hypothetical protein
MTGTATKRTILRLSNKNELTQHIMTSHGSGRVRDIGYGADGKPVTPPSTSAVLQDAQSVRKVTVDRDADGNLYITLEE